ASGAMQAQVRQDGCPAAELAGAGGVEIAGRAEEEERGVDKADDGPRNRSPVGELQEVQDAENQPNRAEAREHERHDGRVHAVGAAPPRELARGSTSASSTLNRFFHSRTPFCWTVRCYCGYQRSFYTPPYQTRQALAGARKSKNRYVWVRTYNPKYGQFRTVPDSSLTSLSREEEIGTSRGCGDRRFVLVTAHQSESELAESLG